MNKKLIGALLISTGIVCLTVIAFKIVTGSDNELVSPIPNQSGVKVIYIRPSK